MTTVEARKQSYARLVQQRKSCRACDGLVNPALHAGYDSEHIGPWSRLHGDLNAKLMIVGQDWGDEGYFLQNRGWDAPHNPTTETLAGLLRGIGFDVQLNGQEASSQGIFLTNAIQCLKQGHMQAAVDSQWFSNCGGLFLRQLLEIVNPPVVVTLGDRAYRAICDVFHIRPLQLRDAVNGSPIPLPFGGKLVAVYHCGRRVLNTHRSLEEQQLDWQRVKDAL